MDERRATRPRHMEDRELRPYELLTLQGTRRGGPVLARSPPETYSTAHVSFTLPALFPSDATPVRVDVCGRTDVGRTREHNEDAYLVADVSAGSPLPSGGVSGYPARGHGLLFMVADGMGGAAAGEIASDMAVQTVLDELANRWSRRTELPPPAFARALREAAEEANRRIHHCATEHPEYRGMGTTATIAGLLGDTLYVAQVGDSRAYLVRAGRALQITKDQSLLQRLVEAGELTEEEAERSARRNIILQALGPEERVVIDLTHQQVRRGDVLILCSDGLSNLVRPEDIERLVAGTPGPCELCDALIDAANASGGPDNITVVAVRFEGEGLEEAHDGDEVGHRRFVEDGVPEPDPDDWVMGPISTSETPVGTEEIAETDAQPRPPGVVPREKGPAVVRALRLATIATLAVIVGGLLWRWLAA